ncbi:putative ATPase associated with various cellular activities aaa_3 protein [Rosellinia necatrix]|uniref:Putative ATPase associated with various cellular activities aaa_3 protein n=1 Tax=Rosellinia necatrix TaxID=77044 RepID=A0A1W2TLF7_ROSNE|nr:putative ATPase associated with various cellular activities aaa_3 protein [Rosellinia necatrix]
MADEDLVRKVRELGDIDLAVLLCLTSREHCIISTDAEYLDDLTVELQLVASNTFGLNSAVVDCTPETTLDDLVAAIHLPQPKPTPITRSPSPLHTRGAESYFSTHHGNGIGGAHSQQHQNGARRPPSSLSPGANVAPTSPSRSSLQSTSTQQQQIANVILARNLNTAPMAVQIQCLELMRTRRIFTRTTVQLCPKQFLLIAVLGSESAGQARLTKHLNDYFYISHWQDPEDGFSHLDGGDDDEGGEGEYNTDNNSRRVDRGGEDARDDDDTASQASSASVVRRTRSSKTPSTPIPTPTRASAQGNSQVTDNNSGGGGGSSSTRRGRLFTETDISALSALGLQTHVDIEVQRYQMNIVAFLRLHRAVTPGSVPPAATTHFRALVRSLAALHGLGFATPELVRLAARKIYAHHIAVVPAERERSMQWGSDLAVVKALLEDVQPEDVIEDVLGMVDVPV